MEYWEFLLQQEGDHHWLPLDTAQMEILEGRYRIMAHTSQPNTPVQVQVSQRLLDQDPPKRRSFKRQGQTNGDGLMVVIPFTRLQAGTWDIRCSSVPPEDHAPNESGAAEPAVKAGVSTNTAPAWAYSVQLQVLPPGMGDDEVWTLPPAEPAFELPPPRPRWPQPALDLALTTAALDEAQIDLSTEVLEGWQHRLHLSQTALLGQEGATVDLTGRVTGPRDGEPCQGMALVVRLVDPQTATAVVLTPFPIGSATLPAEVNLALTVPSGLDTRLLLGELALVQSTATAVLVLALQRFTLTVDLADLFDTIANQAETETDYILDFVGGSGLGQSITGEPKEDTTPNRPLDLPQGPPRVVPVLTLPRDGFNLPPKLYDPSPHEVSARQPTLPPFGASPRRLPTSAPVVLSEGSVADPDLPETAIPQEATAISSAPTASSSATPEAKSNASETVAHPAPEAPADRPALSLPPLPTPPPTSPAPEPAPTVPLLPSHEVAGFRDLNLQDRFWSRLNEMAVAVQQEAAQKRSTSAPEPQAQASTSTSGVDEEAEPEPFAGEVVIYEDEDETLGSLRSTLEPVDTADPMEEPISPPVPELEVPSGDLMAGETILLTLRVPFHPNRLYLKVWIMDPQTRSLMDEPRQVMHLRPNGHGQLEGTVQVTVPLGCLEAEFEAIAVDMMTQQESYKITVGRSIVPAGVSTPDLGDLDDL